MKRHASFASFICCLIIVNIVRANVLTVQPRIIIVGAGAAGVAAASRLYQNGKTNVTILEASERLGGRVSTTPFGSGVVELGAQWCHGEKDNVVYQLASVFPGLLKSSIAANNVVLLRSNGMPVPEKVSEQLMALAEGIVESDERQTFAGSLGEFFTQKYWSRLQTDLQFRNITRELAEQFLVYYHNFERGYNAYDTWYEVAASESDHYVESEGNQVLAWTGKRGFTTILDIVSGNYPGTTDITLTPVPLEKIITYGKFVSNIQWKDTVDGEVVITTQDGFRYEADHIIVTVSLGVLKENCKKMFTPTLPAVNQDAITGLHFGTVNKVYIFFEGPVPEDFPNVLQLLWYESDVENLRRSNHAWTEAISTFYRIDGQPNVLAAWMNGVEGRQSELLPDATIIEGVLHILDIFAKHVQFGNVQAVLRSNWSSNPFFRGSYSSRSITTEQMKTGPEYLATPLMSTANVPVVLFAGEATNRKQYSTVHGAIESGRREADRLLQLYF